MLAGDCVCVCVWPGGWGELWFFLLFIFSGAGWLVEGKKLLHVKVNTIHHMVMVPELIWSE